MILTEAEAAKVWCPLVRLFIPKPAPGYNRAAGWSGGAGTEAVDGWTRERTCCIASACSQWRRISPSTGYCGRAGPPGPYDLALHALPNSPE